MEHDIHSYSDADLIRAYNSSYSSVNKRVEVEAEIVSRRQKFHDELQGLVKVIHIR